MDSDEWQWPHDLRGYVSWQGISFYNRTIRMDFMDFLPEISVSDVSAHAYIAGQHFRNRPSPTWFLRRCHVTSLQSGKFTSCKKRGRRDRVRACIVRENIRNWNSELDDRSSIAVEAKILLFSTMSSSAFGPTQPRIQFHGGKPAGSRSWPLHTVPRSRMVELYVFMAWCLIKHRDNFPFMSYENMCEELCQGYYDNAPVSPYVSRSGEVAQSQNLTSRG
jgi:hypothetical protein